MKSFFLLFSEEEILSTVQFGQILQKRDDQSNIYINGVKVAIEDDFLFSYNITSLKKTMKKELNRERTNVGRTAYSSRVKQILLENKEASTTKLLVDDIDGYDFKIVTISENLRDALGEVKDDAGNPIRNLETFATLFLTEK